MAVHIKKIDNWHLGPCICHHSVVSWPIIYVRVVCVSLMCLIPSEPGTDLWTTWGANQGWSHSALLWPVAPHSTTIHQAPHEIPYFPLWTPMRNMTPTWNFALYNFHTSKVFKETGHETDNFPFAQSCSGDINSVRWQTSDTAPNTPVRSETRG